MIRETEPICLTWILLIPRGAWNETFLFSPDPGTTTGGSTPTIRQVWRQNWISFLFVLPCNFSDQPWLWFSSLLVRLLENLNNRKKCFLNLFSNQSSPRRGSVTLCSGSLSFEQKIFPASEYSAESVSESGNKQIKTSVNYGEGFVRKRLNYSRL